MNTETSNAGEMELVATVESATLAHENRQKWLMVWLLDELREKAGERVNVFVNGPVGPNGEVPSCELIAALIPMVNQKRARQGLAPYVIEY